MNEKQKWTQANIKKLLSQTNDANKTASFLRIAKQMNLKPGTVRNYYYSGMWRKHLAKQDEKTMTPQIKSFDKFEYPEARDLIRAIVLGYSRGESIRSICLKHAKGNPSKMLRYQNKYRNIMANSPEQINKIAASLENEGYFIKNPISENQPSKQSIKQEAELLTMPQHYPQTLTDQDIQNLFMGVIRLVRKQNQSQIETMRSEIARLTRQVDKSKAD